MSNIIALLALSIRLIIGVNLLLVLRRTKMKNLLTLAVVFLINAVSFAFTFDFSNNSFLFYTLIDIAMVFHLIFTEQTFFSGRKSPLKFILPSSLVLGTINAVTIGIYTMDNTLTDMFLIGKIFFALNHYVVWGWFLFVAYTSYKKLSGNSAIEDWVKARYRLMIYYAVLIIVPATLLIFSASQTDVVTITAAVLAMVSWILQFVVWVMPETIRRILNRNYVSPVNEADMSLTEEEILAME